MLTRKYLKTIIVNLGVNYCQFKGCILFGWKNTLGALATPNKKILPKASAKLLLKSTFSKFCMHYRK